MVNSRKHVEVPEKGVLGVQHGKTLEECLWRGAMAKRLGDYNTEEGLVVVNRFSKGYPSNAYVL